MAKSKYSTASHIKILEFLKANGDRVVKEGDIDAFLKSEGVEVNPSTIYRYLNHLSEDGQIIKYAARKGEMSSFQYIGDEDNECKEHLHLHCIKCDRIIHLDCGFMEEVSGHIMSHHGFLLQCESSVLYGICKECQREIVNE